MDEVIIVKPEKCVGCNACVRTCPAPEANRTVMREDGSFVTTVDPDKCIACGECVKHCQHDARDYVDDTDEFMKRVNSKEKIIILAAPAMKAVFPDNWKGILNYFRKKGCLVYDVSLGADICTWAHLRAIERKRVGNIITQPCAAIVNYIQTYRPNLLKNLSPIHSPVGCEAIYIKKYLKRNNPIAMFSPCVAKKTEFRQTGLVDFNVTYKKLQEYFDKNDIIPQTDNERVLDYGFDDQQGQLGGVYSRPGGLRDNLWQHNPNINITNSEGVQKVYAELDMYGDLPDFKHPEVFDVLSCEYGCNVGPGTGGMHNFFDVTATMREVEKNARKRMKGGGIFGGGDDKLFKSFDDELALDDFMRTYKAAEASPEPTDEELNAIFESMGKHSEPERNYNCHACGHRSCREMAVSIFRGLNTPNNCIIHARAVLVAKHSELSIRHSKLADVTYECLELANELSNDIQNITGNMKTISESNNKTSERAKVVNDLLKNVILFCNGNSTMDANTVQQLIKILETTSKAFGALDDNVNATNESSAGISASIDQINELIKKLTETLRTTESM